MKKFLVAAFMIIFNNWAYTQILEKDIRLFPGFDSTLYPFYFGIASGDADSNSCVIWTKIVPKIHYRSIDVYWEVALDTNFKNIIKKGKIRTDPSLNYIVKLKITGLKSATEYYYRFKAWRYYSPWGRLKTLPSMQDTSPNITFAVFTGSNYAMGYFNVYREISKHPEIDFLIHTGDYIYEYPPGSLKKEFRKVCPKNNLITYQDYDIRYACYRLDKDLQQAHRLFTWYVIWDDHEFATNAWKSGSQENISNNLWWKRKHNALKAYFNWLPILPTNDTEIYRSFDAGKLARLIFIDTRVEGRDWQKIPINDTTKKIMSTKQWEWLFNKIQTANNNWIFIIEQVMFAPLKYRKKILNTDQWDGYPHERKKLLSFLYNHKIENAIIISGDLHSSMANELYFHNHMISAELMAPSITSRAIDGLKALLAKHILRLYNPQIRFLDFTHRGYLLITVKDSQLEAKWILLNTVRQHKYRIHKIKKMKLKNRPIRFVK